MSPQKYHDKVFFETRLRASVSEHVPHPILPFFEDIQSHYLMGLGLVALSQPTCQLTPDLLSMERVSQETKYLRSRLSQMKAMPRNTIRGSRNRWPDAHLINGCQMINDKAGNVSTADWIR